MRTRLLVTLGALVALAGAVVTAVALTWLATNSGFSSELVVTGQQFKYMSAALGGLWVGLLAFAVGLLVGTVGYCTRARVQR